MAQVGDVTDGHRVGARRDRDVLTSVASELAVDVDHAVFGRTIDRGVDQQGAGLTVPGGRRHVRAMRPGRGHLRKVVHVAAHDHEGHERKRGVETHGGLLVGQGPV